MSLEARFEEAIVEREIPEEVIETARALLTEYEYKGGRAPSTLAAGALYLAWLASKYTPPDQQVIAAWFDRSQISLRNGKGDLIDHFGQQRLSEILK